MQIDPTVFRNVEDVLRQQVSVGDDGCAVRLEAGKFGCEVGIGRLGRRQHRDAVLVGKETDRRAGDFATTARDGVRTRDDGYHFVVGGLDETTQ